MRTMVAVLLISTFYFTAVAQERVQEFTEPGRSASPDSGTAKQEAIQDAISKVTNRLVREMLGDSRFESSKEVIKSKVVARSDRFVPFLRAGVPKQEGGEQVFPITLRVSITNLESVLKGTGLLQANDGPQTLLPLVGFVDLVNNRTFKWWVQEESAASTFLKSQERALFESLKKGIKEQGWSVINPEASKYRAAVPERLRIESPRSQEVVSLAEHMKSQMVVRGEMRVEPGATTQTFKVALWLRVVQTPSGRTVADAVRAAETEPGVFASTVGVKAGELFDDAIVDVYGQIQDAMSRGALGTQVVRLVLEGWMTPKQLEILKEDLRFQVRTVKRVTDRLFARGRIELDVDVTGGPQALAQTLQNTKFRETRWRLDRVEGDRVYALSVK